MVEVVLFHHAQGLTLGVVAVLSVVGAVYVVVGAIAWATLPKRQMTGSPNDG